MATKIPGNDLISSDKTILAWLGKRATDTLPNGQPKKIRRLRDGNGLFLLDTVDDVSKPAWRYEFKFEGKDKLISLGTYPGTTLLNARKKAQEARDLVAGGINPSAKRKGAKAKAKAKAVLEKTNAELIAQGKPPKAPYGSFWHVLELLREYKVNNLKWGQEFATTAMAKCKLHWYPVIGTKQLSEIDSDDMRLTLHVLQTQGKHETARCILNIARQVFDYGRNHPEKFCKHNMAYDLNGMLDKGNDGEYAIIQSHKRLGEVVRAVAGYQNVVMRSAMLLQIMLFQRPGNTTKMQWDHIDWDTNTWVIPAREMKMKTADKHKTSTPAHCVPLPPQAIAILRALEPVTRPGKYVFSCKKDNGLSTEALRMMLRRLGFGKEEITPHGFRGTAKTMMLNEMGLGALDMFIELSLAHVYGGANGTAYTRAQILETRRQINERWADALDAMRDGTFKSVMPHVPAMGAPVANADVFSRLMLVPQAA